MPTDQIPPRVADFKARAADDALDSRLAWGIALPCSALLLISEVLLYANGYIGKLAFWLSLPLDIPLVYAMVRLMTFLTSRTAHHFSRFVYSSADIAPSEAFSFEESLILRGHTDQAEASYRARWEGVPPSFEAGRRLAELLIGRGREDEALAIFESLRRAELPSHLAMTVANRIIDLHHRAGRADRLKVELSRFADDHRGTGAGEHAARRLRELKEADRKAEAEGDD